MGQLRREEKPDVEGGLAERVRLLLGVGPRVERGRDDRVLAEDGGVLTAWIGSVPPEELEVDQLFAAEVHRGFGSGRGGGFDGLDLFSDGSVLFGDEAVEGGGWHRKLLGGLQQADLVLGVPHCFLVPSERLTEVLLALQRLETEIQQVFLFEGESGRVRSRSGLRVSDFWQAGQDEKLRIFSRRIWVPLRRRGR